MKIRKHAARELVIQSDDMEPITVLFVDIDKNSGRVSIEQSGQHWLGHWKALGTKSVARMFAETGSHTLARQLTRLNLSTYDRHGIQKSINSLIASRRRKRELTKLQARFLFEACSNIVVPKYQALALSEVFGSQWSHALIHSPEPHIENVVEMVETIQLALAEDLAR